MADTNNNINIDISGNTASMATDYGLSGVCLGSSHVPLSKMIWGDSDNGKRVDLSNPLPMQFAGQTGPIEIYGKISGQTNGNVQIRNYVSPEGNLTGNWGHVGYGTSAVGQHTHFVAVAGNTTGRGYGAFVGVTGTIQGIANGFPVEITGDIRLLGSMAKNVYGASADIHGILVQGTSAGNTATVAGEVFPGYGFGVPVAITAGRRLNYEVDSIRIDNTTIGISGGRQLTSATDTVAVYGYDGGSVVHTMLHSSADGITAGFSGDALKVAIVNAAEGITFSVSVQAVTGVTNASEPPLRVQGYTAGAGHNPVIVKGTNNGALEVFANTSLNTNVVNSVEIQDQDILNALQNSTKPLISNLSSIKGNTNLISNIHTDMTTGRGVSAKITSIDKPSAVRSGSKTISGNQSTQMLHNNLELKTGITVKLSPSSSTNVLIGSRSLSNNVSNGYLLEPGESVYLEVNNVNKIYIKTEDTSQNITATLYYIGS